MDECARMACDQQAVALLTFAPQQAKAWLYDLIDANPATGIMLCRRHANATVVPMSWHLVDGRDPSWTPPEAVTYVDETITYRREVPAVATEHPHGVPHVDHPRYRTERIAAHHHGAPERAVEHETTHQYRSSERATGEVEPTRDERTRYEGTRYEGTRSEGTRYDAALPSDLVGSRNEFDGLRNDLPIAAEPYAAPRAAQRSSGTIPGPDDLLATSLRQRLLPDPSLFELSIDAPAVTPHPTTR